MDFDRKRSNCYSKKKVDDKQIIMKIFSNFLREILLNDPFGVIEKLQFNWIFNRIRSEKDYRVLQQEIDQ